jgi:hypothetical protein
MEHTINETTYFFNNVKTANKIIPKLNDLLEINDIFNYIKYLNRISYLSNYLEKNIRNLINTYIQQLGNIKIKRNYKYGYEIKNIGIFNKLLKLSDKIFNIIVSLRDRATQYNELKKENYKIYKIKTYTELFHNGFKYVKKQIPIKKQKPIINESFMSARPSKQVDQYKSSVTKIEQEETQIIKSKDEILNILERTNKEIRKENKNQNEQNREVYHDYNRRDLNKVTKNVREYITDLFMYKSLSQQVEQSGNNNGVFTIKYKYLIPVSTDIRDIYGRTNMIYKKNNELTMKDGDKNINGIVDILIHILKKDLKYFEPITNQYIKYKKKDNTYEGYYPYSVNSTFLNASQNLSIGEYINRIKNNKIFDISPIKLPYDIQSNNIIFKHNCAKQVIYDMVKGKNGYSTCEKILKSDMDTAFNFEKLTEFMKTYKIQYKIFGINGKLLDTNKTKAKSKVLRAILCNNHLYEVDKKELTLFKKKILKSNIKIKNVIHCQDNDELMCKLRDNHKIIDRITVFFNKFSDSNGNLYILDKEPDYNNKMVESNDAFNDKCFNLITKITDIKIPRQFDFHYFDIFSYILEKNNLYSTFDNLGNPKPVNYYSDTFAKTKKGKQHFYAQDKNCAYLYNIITLKHFPVIDATTILTKYNNEEIVDTTFYHVREVLDNSLGLVSAGWSTGYRLKHLHNTVDIDYYIIPKLYENPLCNIFNDLIKEDLETAKKIAHRFVGMLQRENDDKEVTCYKGIYENQADADISGSFSKRVLLPPKNDDDDYTAVYVSFDKTIFVTPKYQKSYKAFAHYVIDTNISGVIERALYLSKTIPDIKICKINTDCVGFYSESYDESKMNLNRDDISGWKSEKFKHRNNDLDFYEQYHELNLPDIEEYHSDIDINNNIFVQSNAGSGKTYKILNDIIQKIGDSSYVITSVTHKALKEYYIKNYPANTIKYFENPECIKKLKEYDYIIIDEFGLLSSNHWKMIYLNLMKHQRLIVFGDYNQCPPVEDKIFSPMTNLLNQMIFDKRYVLTENHRNKYTVNDYDEMKEGKYILTDKENKLMGKIVKDGINMCYFNQTRIYINKKCIKKIDNKIKFGGLKIGKNMKLVTTSNNLKRKEIKIKNSETKTYIYNNTEFIVKDIKRKSLILSSDIFEDIEIFENEFKSNFDYNYAVTLYRIQGESIPYEKIGIHDWYRINQDPRLIYTTLSRIKEDIN